MAQQVELEVNQREVLGKATKRLRKQGIIPANIFGHHEASVAVQLRATDFDRLRRSHAATGMITLHMQDSDKRETAVIRRVQHNPRTGRVVHVDFFRVRLDEDIHVKVALHFVGDAPGVSVLGGVLQHLLETLEVDCRAGDIPEYIEVDVSSLAEIDDMLLAQAVKLPPNVKLLTDAREAVVKVAGTRSEKAVETEEAAAPAPTTPAPTEDQQ